MRCGAWPSKGPKKWMLERLNDSDGLGAIYPPMMYSVMALDVLGYPPDDPVRVEALRQFDSLMVDDGERFFFQPCFSPVWDTAIAAYALGAERGASTRRRAAAADWLLAQEIRAQGRLVGEAPAYRAFRLGVRIPQRLLSRYRRHRHGDAGVEPGARLGRPRAERLPSGARWTWLLAMQSSDGGWAAFDADNNWEFLSHVPFADHNAMLDPDLPGYHRPRARSAGGARA